MLRSFLLKTPSSAAVRHRLSPRCQAGRTGQSHKQSPCKQMFTLSGTWPPRLSGLKYRNAETATMTSVVRSTSTASASAAQPQRLWLHLQGCVDWLLAGPRPQPDDIQNELLQQRTNKTKTAVLASLLIASISAALTGAAWAYAWMLAELVLGSTRIHLMVKALARAKASPGIAANITPVWAGLTSVILIPAGCYQRVGSGILPLALM